MDPQVCQVGTDDGTADRMDQEVCHTDTDNGTDDRIDPEVQHIDAQMMEQVMEFIQRFVRLTQIMEQVIGLIQRFSHIDTDDGTGDRIHPDGLSD